MKTTATVPLILSAMLAFASCRTPPAVIHETFPVSDGFTAVTTNFASPNLARIERDGIRIDVEYLDRVRLLELSKWNKVPSDCDGTEPVMTVVFAVMSNSGDRPIRFDTRKTVLDDGISVLPSLDYDRFKELYPGIEEASCAYGFLFDASAVLNAPPTKIALRKGADAKTRLFRNGLIAPGKTERAFLVFDRTAALSTGFTLTLPGFSLTNDVRPGRSFDAEFRFVQRLRRLKED